MPRTVGFSIHTGSVGPSKRDHRNAQGRGHVPRTAVGGNHQAASFQAGLGQGQPDRLAGQREDARKLGLPHDVAGPLALPGPQKNKTSWSDRRSGTVKFSPLRSAPGTSAATNPG